LTPTPTTTTTTTTTIDAFQFQFQHIRQHQRRRLVLPYRNNFLLLGVCNNNNNNKRLQQEQIKIQQQQRRRQFSITAADCSSRRIVGQRGRMSNKRYSSHLMMDHHQDSYDENTVIYYDISDTDTNSDTDFDSDNDTYSDCDSDSDSTDMTKHQNRNHNVNFNVNDDEDNDEVFFREAERDANRMNYPKGKPNGFYVTKQYHIPIDGFENLVTVTASTTTATTALNDADTDTDDANNSNNAEGSHRILGITQEEVNRLDINKKNITLSVALMLLDKEAYPSLSRARKSCRKGYILINRGPLIMNDDTGEKEFDQKSCIRGRVIDRVYPGDVIGIQCRMHGGFYPGFDTNKPPFELPVVYEDDHFAIVNKPAGIVCYSTRNDKGESSHGTMTVRNALPFALTPPKRGTLSIIRRPVGVHRLDKPTSGLLLVAKTKSSMVDLSNQFVDRRIKKTYSAIVSGIPSELIETSITKKEAMDLGVDVDDDNDDVDNNQNITTCYDNSSDHDTMNGKWQVIDFPLDEKNAVTVWKPVKYVKSLKAKDGILTLVEMKPKTGRYHQLRRHMMWVKDCAIVGDTTYDGGGSDARNLRRRGLFLCSNKVRLDHPYYNTIQGRKEWENLPPIEKWANGTLTLSEDGTNTVEVHASIDLPNKFHSFLAKEMERQKKLG